MRLFHSFRSQKNIAGGAAILACTSLFASAIGFFRDQAFSIMFPPGHDALDVASVYIAAFRPSDLLFQLTIMSCLSVVVVPFLSSHLVKGNREEMDKVTVSTIVVFGTLFGALAIVLAIALPRIAPLLVAYDGQTLALYIRFARLALLSNALFVLGNAYGQYLIASQRYWVYGLTPILWSLSTIAGIYFLTPFLGHDGPMMGTIIGTVLYVLWRQVAMYRLGFRWRRPAHSLLHSDLASMGILLIPRMAALGALQLQLLLLDRLASTLPSGLLAVNQYARNIESVIPGIVGIAIAQSSFSLLSQSAATGDRSRLIRHLRKGISVNLALAIPGALTLAALTPLAPWFLRLSPAMSSALVALLLVYAIAIPFESASHILLRGYYAMKNTMFPASATVISCIVAVWIASASFAYAAALSIAIGFTAGQIVMAILLALGLPFLLRENQQQTEGL